MKKALSTENRMDSLKYIWVIKYNQVLGDVLYACSTGEVAREKVLMLVNENRHRFNEYPEDRPTENDLQYSRMADDELLGWWFEYTELAEDISIKRVQLLNSADDDKPAEDGEDSFEDDLFKDDSFEEL